MMPSSGPGLPFWYALAADVLVAAHVGYVGFVVLGQLAVVVGIARHWGWIRNPWFRVIHLFAISVVAAEAIFGLHCPWTTWERDLRALAGQTTSDISFVGRLIHQVLFVDVPLSVLNACHIGFALLVALTFVLAPPRWPGHRQTKSNPKRHGRPL